MNIQGPGFSFDFRKIEPRRLATRTESTIQRKPELEAQPLVGKDNRKLPAVLTGVKSDISASPETDSSEETTETGTEETVLESAKEPDESGDLSSDYEPINERDEDPEEPDEHTEEQRQQNGNRLDTLETQYRSRFLILDQLIDRLTATHNLLTQQIEDSPHAPHRLGTTDPASALLES